MRKDYIGDGVYAQFDGYTLIVTTEIGTGMPTNTIVLEPEILVALLRYADRVMGTTFTGAER